MHRFLVNETGNGKITNLQKITTIDKSFNYDPNLPVMLYICTCNI